jgi:hypothetical protein
LHIHGEPPDRDFLSFQGKTVKATGTCAGLLAAPQALLTGMRTALVISRNLARSLVIEELLDALDVFENVL